MNIRKTMRTQLSMALAVLFAAESAFGTVKVGNVNVADSNDHYLQYVRHITVPFASQGGATWNAGNDVTGKTAAEVQAIVEAIKAMETDPRQKEIYTRMKATPTEVFAFRDVPHAKATVLQRLETIAMMTKFNVDLRYAYWNEDHPVSTTAGNWEPGPLVNYFFRQKSGSAFASIAQITAPPPAKTYGECWGAITACVWWGASQAMLEPGFNGLYPGAMALNMENTGASYSRNLVRATDSAIHVPGDWVYFKNDNYRLVVGTAEFKKRGWLFGDPKKQIYYWSGENALYLGQGKYGGLGSNAWDVTEAQMRHELMNFYNDDLATVISKLAPQGGFYKGLTIKAITPQTAADRLLIIAVKRLVH